MEIDLEDAEQVQRENIRLDKGEFLDMRSLSYDSRFTIQTGTQGAKSEIHCKAESLKLESNNGLELPKLPWQSI